VPHVKIARFFSTTCINSNDNQSEEASNPIYLGPLIAKYIEFNDFTKNRSAHTLRAYLSDLMQVFQLKDNCSIKGPKISGDSHYFFESQAKHQISMTYEEMELYIKKFTENWDHLSPKSKKRKMSAVSTFLDWLKTHEKLNHSIQVFSQIKTPRIIPHFISVDECLSLIEFLKQQKPSKASSDQELLFYLLYGCGLRVSEACNIQWINIDFNRRTITILGKGRKERLAMTPLIVLEKLKCRDRNNELWIWGEKSLATRKAYEMIRQLGRSAGLLQSLHPHALRHSYATHLLTSGSDLRVLQQLLGHTNLSATELYTHLDIDHLARSMEMHHPLSKKSIK
jgi:site-specific recombinase XerD